MKALKKGAFANTATGYGKKSHSAHCPNKNSGKSTKSDLNSKKDNDEKPTTPKTEESEEDLNSGFSDYLRSDEGVEMMKLFVFANSIVVILTMVWPHAKEQYIWFMQWLDTFNEE